MSTKYEHTSSIPKLDDMLQSLLIVEEGEHEFSGAEGVKELRHHFFPVTRHNIYLNHASMGPLPEPVARTMHEYVDDASSFGNIHKARWEEYERGAHRRLASLIHARPNQIALTASSGDGLMLIAQGMNWQEGDTIITAEGEFPTNVYPWLNLQEQGVNLQVVPTRNARIATEDVFANITERTRLVSLSLVEFSTGFRNDIITIAAYCRERGILCGIDAMQALGALDVNVQALGVDYMAAAAHKWLLGPKTCGILYVSDQLLAQLETRRRGWFSVETPSDFLNYPQPLKAGVARFEHSLPNSFPIVGLDATLGVFECIDGGMEAVESRILGLTQRAIAGLEQLGYPIVSPLGQGERSGLVCFSPHPDQHDLTIQQIVDTLAGRRIYVAARGDVVRISPHFYNTVEEIDVLLEMLEEMKRTLHR